MTLHGAVQNVKLDFRFDPQPFLSLTGLIWMYFRFHRSK